MRLLRCAYVGAVLIVIAGCGGTKTVTRTVTVDASAKKGVGAPLEQVEFGYVKTLERKGTGYELTFDPAWFLSGETATAAAAQDGVVAPGEPVPNDNYVVDEGHRLLTYKVSPDAKVTVLVDSPKSEPITLEELAQVVDGNHRPLWEPVETGFWIRYRIDTVTSLDQQYRP
jgi:hypothetical protein